MVKPKLKDPNGPHIRLYHDLIDSPAYRALSAAAKVLLIDLRRCLTGTNNGNVSASFSDLKHKGWKSPATLSKALYELRTLGFIAPTREGGLRMGTRVCTLYRFTDLPVYEQSKVQVQAVSATHDYRRFKSLREAEAAKRNGVAALRAEGRKKQSQRKKSPVQNPNPINTKAEPLERFINTECERGEGATIKNLNTRNCG